jgi:hypothetical protein
MGRCLTSATACASWTPGTDVGAALAPDGRLIGTDGARRVGRDGVTKVWGGRRPSVVLDGARGLYSASRHDQVGNGAGEALEEVFLHPPAPAQSAGSPEQFAPDSNSWGCLSRQPCRCARGRQMMRSESTTGPRRSRRCLHQLRCFHNCSVSSQLKVSPIRAIQLKDSLLLC